MKKESIIYGTVVLLVINLINKALSLFYRGVLIRFIGADGIGMMEMITPVFSFLLVIASWGVPMTMSNQISAAATQKDIKRIFSAGLYFLLINGFIVCLVFLVILYFFKNLIFSDIKVIPGFLPLLPAVILISVFSAYRGYFQGTRRSSYLGYSQLAEQISRIIFGVAIVNYLIGFGCNKYTLLIGISSATFIAELCGGIVLFILFKKENPDFKPLKSKLIDKQLLKSGTPLTASRLIITVGAALQAVLIPYYLGENGYSANEIADFYGNFMGVAVTILHLPGMITGALSVPLLPAISSAHGSNRILLRNQRIQKGLLFSAISAMPLLALSYYFSEPLCRILFQCPEAAGLLKLLCFGGYFLYLQQPLVSALQGMNRFYIIVIFYGIGYFVYLSILIFIGELNLFTEQNIILAYISCDIIIFFCLYLYLTLKEHIAFHFIQWFTIPAVGTAGALIVLDYLQKEIQICSIEIINITVSAFIFLLIFCITIFLCGIPDNQVIKNFRWLRKHR